MKPPAYHEDLEANLSAASPNKLSHQLRREPYMDFVRVGLTFPASRDVLALRADRITLRIRCKSALATDIAWM